MRRFLAYSALLCAFLCFGGLNAKAATGDSSKAKPAKTTVKKKSKKKTVKVAKKKTTAAKKVTQPKKTISLAPPSQLKPTMTGAPGTVKSYFFPDKIGASWKMRTIQVLLDKDKKLVRADTVFAESRVVDTARFSLQRLPLMVTSDSSYRPNDSGVRGESIYYVDDSVAMTVFNNSITHGENRIFLVSPLKVKNAWHEKEGDTIVTMIAGFGDSVITPIGKLNNVMVTLSQQDYSDMRVYFAQGYGIVKSVYRSVGPSGVGLVIVTSEMIEFKKPE
jgi:hypothetical protein